MALPILVALEECSDYSRTVEPYLAQLNELPKGLVDVFSGRQGVVELYTNTNPLVSGFAISVFLGLAFLIVSEINKNYSQVDRCWSILPTLYIIHFDVWARLAGVPAQRLDAAVLFSTIWSIRLTSNYWRKGGYNIGSEDYRWDVIRRAVPTSVFHLLNITFISFIQSILLFLLATPAYALLLASRFDPYITSYDVAYVAMELGLVLVEVFADQQQWDYQTAKQQYQKSAKLPTGSDQVDLDRGFVTTGLWGFSRHPNFAAEQMIWFLFYQWSCYATKVLYSWIAVGPTVLVLLFRASTWLTELITSGKYPEYRDYQASVGMFVPTSITSYKTPVVKPKIIRTSELAKRQNKKQK